MNASNSDGDNALHWAARGGDIDAAKALLAAGIEIDKRGDLGRTPLHEAAGAGHKEMVLLLVEHGADMYALTEGDTPFGVARISRQDEICDVLGPRMKAEQDRDSNKWTRVRIEHLKSEIRRLEQRVATEDDRAGLAFARAWIRRQPGPAAWSNLAAVYATRQRPNLTLARQWYRRAALKGHDRALFEYGLMLIQGEGGPKRPAQGRRYLERAAAIGQLDALKVLAAALSEGGYSYKPSPSRARSANRALRRALKRTSEPKAD